MAARCCQPTAAPPACRRRAAVLLSAWTSALQLVALPSPPLAAHAAAWPAALSLFRPQANAPPRPPVSSALATALLDCVDAAAADVLPPPLIDAAVAQLRARERRFCARLPQPAGAPCPPTLAACLDFELYLRGKALAARLDGAGRERLAASLGERVLDAALPDLAASAKPPDAAAFPALLRALLDALVAGGYATACSLELDALPSLPERPGWADDAAALAATAAAAAAASPAAAPGGLAEGGWRQPQPPAPASAAASAAAAPPQSQPRRAQLRLSRPADLLGGVALRSEEGGWRLRLVADAAAALGRRCRLPGPGPLTADETFFQDRWTGPATAADTLLLALGDPFMSVEVPFEPDSLVVDLSWGGGGGGGGSDGDGGGDAASA